MSISPDLLISPQLLESVDAKLKDRYSSRLSQFGRDPKTLGWDTREHQFYRFKVALEHLPSTAFSITDIGCGFADFKECLDNAGVKALYSGVDINADLIEQAKSRFPETQFSVENILQSSHQTHLSDWVSAFGVLNFKFSEFSNETFARQFIEKAFSFAKEGLIVDMLSRRYCDNYPVEDFVYYYSPAEMLDFALSLTPHVRLIHDYAAIPQREFMLVLKKDVNQGVKDDCR